MATQHARVLSPQFKPLSHVTADGVEFPIGYNGRYAGFPRTESRRALVGAMNQELRDTGRHARVGVAPVSGRDTLLLTTDMPDVPLNVGHAATFLALTQLAHGPIARRFGFSHLRIAAEPTRENIAKIDEIGPWVPWDNVLFVDPRLPERIMRQVPLKCSCLRTISVDLDTGALDDIAEHTLTHIATLAATGHLRSTILLLQSTQPADAVVTPFCEALLRNPRLAPRQSWQHAINVGAVAGAVAGLIAGDGFLWAGWKLAATLAFALIPSAAAATTKINNVVHRGKHTFPVIGLHFDGQSHGMLHSVDHRQRLIDTWTVQWDPSENTAATSPPSPATLQ